MKKLLSMCIAILLVISMSVIPAYAADSAAEKAPASSADKAASESAEDSNEKIAESAKKIETKYGISIKYPKNRDGDAMISMNNIETLDRSLNTMTPGLVKQVSSYYEKKNGRRIEFVYYFADSDYSYGGGVLMAAFEPKSSKIYVFLPTKAGRAIISGENPIALVHEVGHAFHLMCMDLYGEQKMTSEWTKLNGSYRYDSQGLNNNFNESVFISAYATTKYEEDFAETFAHAFVRTAAGTGFYKQLSKNSEPTTLGKKVSYIEKQINTYINNPEQAIENLRKIYKTPMNMTFEGITFYGDNLQYIGYPQPKNILKGIMNGLGLKSQKSTWVRSLGAWRVVATDGEMYYIFPGGAWAKAIQQQQAA